MKYSIIKPLVLYRPQEVVECLCNTPEKFVDVLKTFFIEQIEANKKAHKLKEMESRTFTIILDYLNNITTIPNQQWDYHMPFDGFRKYINEHSIQNYSLMLDKEGKDYQNSRTLISAKESGFTDVRETNSMNSNGLRIADMMAGIFSKLLKALNNSIRYHSLEEGTQKKLLNQKWFQLNDFQLNLYKKLYQIICIWDYAWYKSYAGIFSDDLILLISLLSYMNHFESAQDIKQHNLELQNEYFNAFACEQLAHYFQLRSQKSALDTILSYDTDYFSNEGKYNNYHKNSK